MKNKQLKIIHTLIFVIFLIFLFSSHIYSQSAIDVDSIKAGKSYRITLFNETEYIGKVITVDSAYIKLSVDKTMQRIRKDDIFYVSKDAIPSTYTAIMSAKFGVTFLGENRFRQPNTKNNINAYNIGLESVIPVTEKKGVRFDLHYDRIFRKDEITGYSQYQFSDVHMFSLTGDFLLGDFRSDNRFYYYFNLGGGFHLTYEGPFTETYYSYYDSTYHTHYEDGDTDISLLIDIGATAGIKLSKNLGAFLHLQFNSYGRNNSFLLFWEQNSFPVSLGISYLF